MICQLHPKAAHDDLGRCFACWFEAQSEEEKKQQLFKRDLGTIMQEVFPTDRRKLVKVSKLDSHIYRMTPLAARAMRNEMERYSR